MENFIILHSMLSGKEAREKKKRNIINAVKKALPGTDSFDRYIAFTTSLDDLAKSIENIVANRIKRIAINGGDGFAALVINQLFRKIEQSSTPDYAPDILFLSGGTGNAIAYCSSFRNNDEAVAALASGNYRTEKFSFLETTYGNIRRELSQFIGFGGDAEVIDIYAKQKLKGFFGYLLAIFKFGMTQKYLNPFSRGNGNYTVEVFEDEKSIGKGYFEGGGISAIPFVGYGLRLYPLASHDNSHIRFVRFGSLITPFLTAFPITFTKRANRIIYDYLVDKAATYRFVFDHPVHVQSYGDYKLMHTDVTVDFTRRKQINMVKKT